jgi:hypothetical protein
VVENKKTLELRLAVLEERNKNEGESWKWIKRTRKERTVRAARTRTAMVRLVPTLLTVLVQSCVICPSTAGFWDGASPHDSLARKISYLRGGAGFVSNIMIRQGSNIMKETMAAKDIDAVRCTRLPRLPRCTLPQSLSLSPAHPFVHFCRLPVESSQRGAADDSDEESNVSLNTK